MQQRNKDNIATLIGGVFMDFGNAFKKIGLIVDIVSNYKNAIAIESKTQNSMKGDRISCQNRRTQR